MKHAFRFSTLSLIISTIILTACGGGSGDPAPAAPAEIRTQAVAIEFAAVAGDKSVSCGDTIAQLGTGQTDARLQDLRFYIGNAKLIRADGVEVPLTLGPDDDWNATQGEDSVTLIDLEDRTGACAGSAATNAAIKGSVPAGDYVGVALTLGVPFALNHSNAGADLAQVPAALNNAVNPGMSWSWAGGRKFTKIEVTDPAGSAGSWSAKTFSVHIGSTGCSGDNPAAGLVSQCSAPNRGAIRLASFDPAKQRIAIDLQALLAGNDVTRNLASSSGCMSSLTDPECSAVFDALQIGFNGAAPAADASYQVRKVGDAGNFGLPIDGGLRQTVFRAIAK